MGVLEPVEEAFEEVPATPPGVRDLITEDSSEDDLFAEPKEDNVNTDFLNYKNELSFKNIFPVLPPKGNFEDLLTVKDLKPTWDFQTPPKNIKYCSGCVEDVKQDLKKLAQVVEDYRNERNAARAENEILKKELEELKKILKQKEESEKGDVKLTISNSEKDSVDVFLRKKHIENSRNVFNNSDSAQNNPRDSTKRYGIQSFTISLPKEATRPDSYKATLQPNIEVKTKKTVAELRKEFFAKEFQSEQKTFTAKNYLEIKPEEQKTTVRSKLNIRVKPKQKITELISKLTSKLGNSKVIPEAPQINMIQRFEKTRIVWKNEMEKKSSA